MGWFDFLDNALSIYPKIPSSMRRRDCIGDWYICGANRRKYINFRNFSPFPQGRGQGDGYDNHFEDRFYKE